MKIKQGVCITGIRPEMVVGLMVVNSIFTELGYELVITCGLDGKHSLTSLHYAGAAVDIRTRDMTTSDIGEAMRMISAALPNDFDIIYEGNHFHLEWQPRKPNG